MAEANPSPFGELTTPEPTDSFDRMFKVRSPEEANWSDYDDQGTHDRDYLKQQQKEIKSSLKNLRKVARRKPSPTSEGERTPPNLIREPCMIGGTTGSQMKMAQ